jgi:hypothetical protein
MVHFRGPDNGSRQPSPAGGGRGLNYFGETNAPIRHGPYSGMGERVLVGGSPLNYWGLAASYASKVTVDQSHSISSRPGLSAG